MSGFGLQLIAPEKMQPELLIPDAPLAANAPVVDGAVGFVYLTGIVPVIVQPSGLKEHLFVNTPLDTLPESELSVIVLVHVRVAFVRPNLQLG